MADAVLASRLVLIKGRIIETVTNRPIRPIDFSVELSGDGAARRLSGVPVFKPSGHYAFSIHSSHEVPQPSGAVTITVAVTLADGQVVSESLALDHTDFATSDTGFGSAGRMATSIPNAPFEIDLTVDPKPLTLTGHVVIDHDADAPAVGATIVLGPLSTTVDGQGDFRLHPVPLSARQTLTITHNGADHDQIFVPDFSSSNNFQSYSI